MATATSDSSGPAVDITSIGTGTGTTGTAVPVVPEPEAPALVRVLAGNPVTSVAILACLNIIDAGRLRQLQPAVGGILVGVAWCDTDTPVLDIVKWRAAWPAAVGARVSQRAVGRRLAAPALAALAGTTHLDLHGCTSVTDELLPHLRATLRILNVCSCYQLTDRASFAHLTALTMLDCRSTKVGVAGLPASLQELAVGSLPAGASLAGLTRLRVLRTTGSGSASLDAATLASLPASLLELHAGHSFGVLPRGASFAHLPALQTLDVSGTSLDNASLASMPPSLVSLNVDACKSLSPAAMLPPLPSLRLLDVSNTGIGNALVASLPAGLTELRMSRCGGVTAGATLDHVCALHILHSYSTDLAPGVLAACRARGCIVPAAGMLRGHRYYVVLLVLLSDGRLASGDAGGEVRVWDVAAGGCEAGVVLTAGSGGVALATLRGGHRLAAAVEDGQVEIWDVGVVPPMCTAAVRCSGGGVYALAVLADGRLAVGCGEGVVQIIDVDAGAVAVDLEGHRVGVEALAVLPDGTLVTGSNDSKVRLWDVGARACVATLAGHTGRIRALAVLAGGALASGSDDRTARLWDVGTRTCIAVLSGRTGTGMGSNVAALAALPDGRLASGSDDGTVRVWDTRPDAAAAGSHAADTVPMTAFAYGTPTAPARSALVVLPDGRLAWPGRGGAVHLLHVPPPASYE